jgi:hypothetical protein
MGMTASFPSSVKSFGADRVDGDYIPASDMNTVREEIVAVETAGLAGGWISDPATWTYASASTFTVAGDKTAIYAKGARVKWTQTTVKYGVVLSSSYSSPNTTVTIAVNTDYVITNAVISANYYSNLDEPRGWPGWFNYAATITWTAGTAPTTATISNALYRIVGNTCELQYFFNYTGAGATVTALTINLPVTAVPANQHALASIFVPNGANPTIADISSSTFRVWCTSVSATRFIGSAKFKF